MKPRGDIIRLLISERSDIIEVVVVGIVIALGVNIAANAITPLLNLGPLGGFVVGIAITIVGIIYLFARLFSTREQVREYEAIFIYDAEQNSLINIPRYEFGEDFVHYFQGAFVENPAIKTIWEKEPLCNIRETVWGKNERDEKRPRSMELVSEAVEYYILNKLSVHLSGYFSKKGFRETNLQKYDRGDIPQVLLSNRFFELFSRPMIDRPLFVQQALDESDEETVSVWNEDGTLYDRFDLILPKESQIQRPKPYTIEIRTPRMSLSIQTDFRGFSANLPRGFATLYLGITNAENDEFFQRFMDMTVRSKISVSFKFGALLSATGWEYYHWIDSFLSDLESDFSANQFFTNLNWESVHTIILAQKNAFRHSKS